MFSVFNSEKKTTQRRGDYEQFVLVNQPKKGFDYRNRNNKNISIIGSELSKDKRDQNEGQPCTTALCLNIPQETEDFRTSPKTAVAEDPEDRLAAGHGLLLRLTSVPRRCSGGGILEFRIYRIKIPILDLAADGVNIYKSQIAIQKSHANGCFAIFLLGNRDFTQNPDYVF